jgi:hypothetical protein
MKRHAEHIFHCDWLACSAQSRCHVTMVAPPGWQTFVFNGTTFDICEHHVAVLRSNLVGPDLEDSCWRTRREARARILALKG